MHLPQALPQDLPHPEVLALAHQGLTFNAPLSQARADDLVRRLRVPPGGRVLDLGCGWGKLLLRVCEAYDVEGDGIESALPGVERGRALATARGLAERVRFHPTDLRDWTTPADVVITVGTSHAWGGPAPTLAALRSLVTEGGRVLLGDGVWDRAPSRALQQMFGDLPDLRSLTDLAVQAGLRPLHVATSTLEEFDTWESDWRAGLELSGRPEARAIADERRVEYLDGYRGVLGFAWLVLTPE